jgi:hypothetical protein
MDKKLLIQIPVFLIAICVFAFMIRQYFVSNQKKEELIKNELSGIIISYKDVGRGNLQIDVQTENGIINVHLFGFKKYMHKIQIEDSVHKSAENNVIKIFRRNYSGLFEYHDEFPPLR